MMSNGFWSVILVIFFYQLFVFIFIDFIIKIHFYWVKFVKSRSMNAPVRYWMAFASAVFVVAPAWIFCLIVFKFFGCFLLLKDDFLFYMEMYFEACFSIMTFVLIRNLVKY